jgi:hypothetical protein
VSSAPRGELLRYHRHLHRRAITLQGHPSRLHPLGCSSAPALAGGFLSCTSETEKDHARLGSVCAESFPSARAQGGGIPSRSGFEPAIDAAEVIQSIETRHPIVEHAKGEDRCLSGKRYPAWQPSVWSLFYSSVSHRSLHSRSRPHPHRRPRRRRRRSNREARNSKRDLHSATSSADSGFPCPQGPCPWVPHTTSPSRPHRRKSASRP